MRLVSYTVYTEDPYPQDIPFPGEIADFVGVDNPAGRSTVYAQWKNYRIEWYRDQNTMLSCLMHSFLSQIEAKYKAGYAPILVANPTVEFQVYFQWFLDKFAYSSEKRPETMNHTWLFGEKITKRMKSLGDGAINITVSVLLC